MHECGNRGEVRICEEKHGVVKSHERKTEEKH